MAFSHDKAIYLQIADRLADVARDGIIYNKRGLGYFVAEGGRELIFRQRREDFLRKTLPGVFRQMQLLGLSMQDLERQYAAMTENK